MGTIITLTGSSGSGKTTIAQHLLAADPTLKRVVSLTSRMPRTTDLSGEYRYSYSAKDFADMETQNKFLWNVTAHGNRYGTLRQSVDEALTAPHNSLMILVPEAVVLLHQYAPPRQVISFYIVAPSDTVLKQRLTQRGDSPQNIDQRIADCRTWQTQAIQSQIPYLFVHNDGPVTNAVSAILNFLKSR